MGKLKVNTDTIKSKTAAKYSKTFKISLILGIIVGLVLILNVASSFALKQTVDIVKLDTNVPQDGRVTQEHMVKDTMLKKEYEKQGVYTLADGTKKRAIVLWEDRGRIQNAYASYYIRKDTPLYWDSLTKESPKEYSYLYKMDGELLKLDLEATQFGKMLVPGDKINVRASYTETDYTLPDEKTFQMQQQMGMSNQNTTQRNIKLFNNVTVLDILNAQGESIFDIYYKLLALPKATQQEMVATDTFKQQVEPQQILLNVTPEEADQYMQIGNKSPKFMMTLLPRTSGNLITEALNELQIGFQRSGNGN